MSYEELLSAGVPHDTIVAMGVKAPRAKKEKKSDLEKLRAQLDLEDALLGKTEARQRVIQALGVKFVENNPKTVAGLEAQITANENLLRIEEERKRMNDLVTDSMENGLMAMADGTKTVKEAFRDMAAEIIKELYRILVVQQMVNAAKSFFGFPFADGGAFSGGSQIQAYADGGIVGSPTTFPMAGGKTGLMGEAGPEAIMPLKRGANGKLGVQMEGGGGDTINVVQNFSFQANGDDSVKRIIAQAAPQIANMTKKSMLDDRRRGGTTKAVFG
jgi:phage-related minor tail protein